MSPPRRSGTAAEERERDHRSTEDRRWRLEDQRDFLVRSLADLRAEHDAGDLASLDFEALLARDEGRLLVVEGELAALETEVREFERAAPARASDPAPGQSRAAGAGPARRRRPLWLAVVATVALAAGATLLVIHLASPRLPGQPETGSASLNLAKEVENQLAQATILVEEGTPTSLDQALTVYRTVLLEDPTQPQALAEMGWLEWEAGFAGADAKLEGEGRALVVRSLKVERNDYAAHLFLGTIELRGDHDPEAAVTQYKAFLSERPPKAQIVGAAGFIKAAFQAVGQPVPAAVGG